MVASSDVEPVGERGHEEVGEHDRVDTGVDRGLERRELAAPQGREIDAHGRDPDVGVDRGVAVAGGVLRAASDARLLQTGHERDAVARHDISLAGDGARREHHVREIGGDVENRSEGDIHPARSEQVAEGAAGGSGCDEVVQHAVRACPGQAGAPCGLDPGDVAALLVDRDHQVGVRGPQIGDQPRRGRGIGGVAREQADAAETIGIADPVRHLGTLERGEQDGMDSAGQIEAGHEGLVNTLPYPRFHRSAPDGGLLGRELGEGAAAVARDARGVLAGTERPADPAGHGERKHPATRPVGALPLPSASSIDSNCGPPMSSTRPSGGPSASCTSRSATSSTAIGWTGSSGTISTGRCRCGRRNPATKSWN